MRQDTIAEALFGKASRAILSLLFTRTDEQLYLRQIVRSCGTGHGATQRALKSLSDAGIITRRPQGRQVYFQANAACPVFKELKGIIVKTVGVADVLRAALAPLAEHIRVAFVYGSFAAGREKRGSDVDVMVVVGWKDPKQPGGHYLGKASDPRWRRIIDAAVDAMIAHGPFISALVVGESLFDSNLPVALSARREGKILWTSRPT